MILLQTSLEIHKIPLRFQGESMFSTIPRPNDTVSIDSYVRLVRVCSDLKGRA